MFDPLDRQAVNNRSSRASWDRYTAHRRVVTGLLTAAGGGRLCVLGAGNSNDLDLPGLLAAYREVHLVDLDREALEHGTAFQRVADHPGVRLHTADVTGVAGSAAWAPSAMLPPDALTACAEAPARSVVPAVGGPFDCAASVGLLSQLVQLAVDGVGERHPQFVPLVQALRLGHLRLLAELVRPGGTGLLVTEVVSSDTCPELPRVPPEALEGLLAELVRQQNFFTGLNPSVVVSTFRQDPVLATACERVEALRPWLWDFGARVYAVWALRFRRAATATPPGPASAGRAS